ncbi:MAG: hypothetical protein KF824_05435 [Fimbriimonadaceae bacterium]|nr:MAG: hypothetical protein KF824_05435 [Fimbriimonadaceae bacterium]
MPCTCLARLKHAGIWLASLALLLTVAGCSSRDPIQATWIEQESGSVLEFHPDRAIEIDQLGQGGAAGRQSSGSWSKSGEGLYAITAGIAPAFTLSLTSEDQGNRAKVSSPDGNITRTWVQTTLSGQELDRLQESLAVRDR